MGEFDDKDAIIKQKDEKIKKLEQGIASIEKDMEKFKDYEIHMKTKDDLIKNLQNSMNLKDDQIQTLKDSMSLIEGQVKTLESSLKLKDEKIRTIEKSIELKDEQLESTIASTVNMSVIEERENQINSLQEKLSLLTVELNKADEDLESLEQENETLRNKLASSSVSQIVDWTQIIIPKTEILEKMRDILSRALHNVTIAVPNIKDLQDLYLYEVRTSVNMRISCYIDPTVAEDSELLEEFESLDNITIRLYDAVDRYVIDRDGEELMFAVIGDKDNNHLVIHTKDPKHIKFFKSQVMEVWLRSRKIE